MTSCTRQGQEMSFLTRGRHTYSPQRRQTYGIGKQPHQPVLVLVSFSQVWMPIPPEPLPLR